MREMTSSNSVDNITWDTVCANKFCASVTDGTHDSPKPQKFGKKLITSKHLMGDYIDFDSANWISENDYKKIISRSIVEQWDVLFSMIGTIGNIYIEKNPVVKYACKNMGIFKFAGNKENAYWMYYYLQSPQAKEYFQSHLRGSTQSYVPLCSLREMPVTIPDKKTRNGIVSLLRSLDVKIAINREINDNLQQQAMALYRQMFVETNNDARRECRADEYFDISIGKTPPRKEAQWFSMNPIDCIWVSISDMGRCGMYIADSSEYLTHESVDKFNIKVVPDNTVLLSFKLTVGRVAITDGAMVTNEAIAHFKTDKPEINEYLYCYLKDFNYQTMGSTSSIATAVNSKIIKAMPFVVPTDTELVSFHSATAPMFEMIKTRQRENTRLAELRDSLLPKLMSGEIDVSAVKL